MSCAAKSCEGGGSKGHSIRGVLAAARGEVASAGKRTQGGGETVLAVHQVVGFGMFFTAKNSPKKENFRLIVPSYRGLQSSLADPLPWGILFF